MVEIRQEEHGPAPTGDAPGHPVAVIPDATLSDWFSHHRAFILAAAIGLLFLVWIADVPVLWAGIAVGMFFAGHLATSALPRLNPAQRAAAVDVERARREAEANVPHLASMVAIVEAMPQATYLLNGDGNVVCQNAPAKSMMSPVPRDQHISSIMRAPEVLQAVERAIGDGRPMTVSYFDRVPVNRWLEAHVAPVDITRLAGGKASTGHVILQLTDLTQQRRLERMRADFVANASHELRTPLAALLGFIETLQGSAKDDPAARESFLQIMLEQANRMARLISDLMSLSRIESNAHVRPESTVDIVSVVGKVADALTLLASQSNVTVNIDRPEGTPVTVVGDEEELAQVFHNLVENAIRYGIDGGRVDIGVQPVAGHSSGQRRVDVFVRDYGRGIDAEHLPRLTERFYRVDIATSREKGGTGLGLAIVKHILNRHRGTLRIESEPGKGATFIVRLDLAAGASAVLPGKHSA